MTFFLFIYSDTLFGTLSTPDYMLMKSIEEFWNFKYDRSNLFSSWINMIEKKFKSQKELKDIPIRELIEMEATAQINFPL